MALKKTLGIALIVALSLPLLQAAEVYHWSDVQGGSHYSDRPHPGSTVLAIDPGVQYFWVEKVFDGDTILLSNGRKVRFLGINTPEVAGRNKQAEAGGEQAKQWLKAQLEGKKVALEPDVEREDAYHRLLAHVFTEEKQHLNLVLVEQGLAFVSIHPPNLKYAPALYAAQASAEQEKQGLWADERYQAQPYTDLDESNYQGWHRITGIVKAAKRTAKSVYLQFSETVAIQLDNADLDLFPSLDVYSGKRVEARGWVSRSKGRFAIKVRHPGDIKLLSSK